MHTFALRIGSTLLISYW